MEEEEETEEITEEEEETTEEEEEKEETVDEDYYESQEHYDTFHKRLHCLRKENAVEVITEMAAEEGDHWLEAMMEDLDNFVVENNEELDELLRTAGAIDNDGNTMELDGSNKRTLDDI